MSQTEITPAQRAKEKSVVFAVVIDTAFIIPLVAIGVIGGSLTIMAEALRAVLGYLSECFTLLLLRRIHRGTLREMEFGTGKIEQVANFLMGATMVLAAGWIGLSALQILAGQRELGTPAGLAAAAIIGMLNLYVNLLAWQTARSAAAASEPSLLMDAQLTSRRVKLASSAIVIFFLTVAALSTDDVIVAWADALGSLFVAAYLVVNASVVLRNSAGDLIDLSAGRDVEQAVRSIVAVHIADYASLDALRSRRSGNTTFIELALGFDPHLGIGEVFGRTAAIRKTIEEQINGAEVSIVTTAASLAKPDPSRSVL